MTISRSSSSATVATVNEDSKGIEAPVIFYVDVPENQTRRAFKLTSETTWNDLVRRVPCLGQTDIYGLYQKPNESATKREFQKMELTHPLSEHGIKNQEVLYALRVEDVNRPLEDLWPWSKNEILCNGEWVESEVSVSLPPKELMELEQNERQRTNSGSSIAKSMCAPPLETPITKPCVIKRNHKSSLRPKVFGLRLTTLAERAGHLNENDLPVFLDHALQFLELPEIITSEGLFRKSGMSTDVKTMKTKIDEGHYLPDYVNLARENDQVVHAVAGVVKMFFRELPETLIPLNMFDMFVSCQCKEPALTAARFYLAVRRLPRVHFKVAKRLFCFLYQVSMFQEYNLMTASNLAVVMAPNLLISPRADGLDELALATATVRHLIELAPFVFSSKTFYQPYSRLVLADNEKLLWIRQVSLDFVPASYYQLLGDRLEILFEASVILTQSTETKTVPLTEEPVQSLIVPAVSHVDTNALKTCAMSVSSCAGSTDICDSIMTDNGSLLPPTHFPPTLLDSRRRSLSAFDPSNDRPFNAPILTPTPVLDNFDENSVPPGFPKEWQAWVESVLDDRVALQAQVLRLTATCELLTKERDLMSQICDAQRQTLTSLQTTPILSSDAGHPTSCDTKASNSIPNGTINGN